MTLLSRKSKELTEWVTWRRNLRAIFPDDLLKYGLAEEEPTVYNEAVVCDENIIRLKKELENSVSSQALLLPSILTEGWDRPQLPGEHKINWADMENLLKFYALGLYFKGKEMTPQANHDFKELSEAAQRASISRRYKRGIPAARRIERATSYLSFGLKTLDAFFDPSAQNSQIALHDLSQEIKEAYTSNYYNGAKLQKSKDMAMRVGRIICDRYNG